MKTPRELLLEKHRSAERKLADIRPEDLAACARADARETPPAIAARAGFADLARQFWREAIWPWRRVWGGLAAVWLAILALNLPDHDLTARGMAAVKSFAPDAETRVVLREQKLLLAELLESTEPSKTVRQTVPGPRSDLREELFIG